MLFGVGKRVQLNGDVPDLAGDYEVTLVQSDAVTLQNRSRNQTVVLRPRHAWLRDHHGESVDLWTVCNLFVNGHHVTNVIVTAYDADNLRIETGA